MNCDFQHPYPEHPCAQRPEDLGTPCRFCGLATPLDGSDCPRCWRPVDVPTFRAWMAAEGFNTTVEGSR